MIETPTIREAISAALDAAKLGLKLRPRQTLECEIVKGVIARLAIDGLTINALAQLTGYPDTTIRSWRDRDPAFAAALDGASDVGRTRLMTVLWSKAESDETVVPGVGQALNALSHLILPELRTSKVETTPSAPDPDVAAAKLLQLVSKGEDKTTPDAI